MSNTQDEPGRKFWKVAYNNKTGCGRFISTIRYKTYAEADKIAEEYSRKHPDTEVFIMCVTRVHHTRSALIHKAEDLD